MGSFLGINIYFVCNISKLYEAIFFYHFGCTESEYVPILLYVTGRVKSKRLEISKNIFTADEMPFDLTLGKKTLLLLPFFCSCEKQSGAAEYSAMSDISDNLKVWIQEVSHQTLMHTGVLQEGGGLVPAGPDSY